MEKAKVLVIDDNEAVLTTLRLVLRSAFTTVVAVSNPQLIPALIREGDVDAVLLDMNFAPKVLDGQEGLFWLERILQRSQLDNPPAVVMITAFGDVELAVESLKRGADDFVQKPWDNEKLVSVLHEAIAKRRQRAMAAAAAESHNAAAYTNETADDKNATDTLEEMEQRHIQRVLDECNHNLQEAAARLGISRSTLYSKLKKWGL